MNKRRRQRRSMISDILADAIHAIQEYQEGMSDAYGGLAGEINLVTTVMDALRLYLDSGPPVTEEHGKLLEDLRRAIRSLDMSGVAAARDRFLAYVQAVRHSLGNSSDSS